METGKFPSAIKRCITRESVGTIRKPTLTVNPYLGAFDIDRSFHDRFSLTAFSYFALRCTGSVSVDGIDIP
jgi:hypothetical protein